MTITPLEIGAVAVSATGSVALALTTDWGALGVAAVLVITAIGAAAKVIISAITDMRKATIDAARDTKVATVDAIEALRIDTANKLLITTEITKALEQQAQVAADTHARAVKIETLANGTNSLLSRDLMIANKENASLKAQMALMTEAKLEAAAVRVENRTDIATALASVPAMATAAAAANGAHDRRVDDSGDAVLKDIEVNTDATAKNTARTDATVQDLKDQK